MHWVEVRSHHDGSCYTTRHERPRRAWDYLLLPRPDDVPAARRPGADRGGAVPGVGVGDCGVTSGLRTYSAGPAGLRGWGVGWWSGTWRTYLWAVGSRRCWCACGASPARTAAGCACQDTIHLAEPRARPTRSTVQRGLRSRGLESMSLARIAQALGVAWHTASTVILTRAE